MTCKPPLAVATILMFLLVLGTTFFSLSSGSVSGQMTGGENGPEDPPPVILSHLEGNDVVKFWAEPDQIVSVLYDNWQIYLFGDINETYEVRIGGEVEFNGTLDRQWINLSFNADKLDLTKVVIRIGNKTWKFENVRVNHEDIGYDPFEKDNKGGKYTLSELNWYRFKTAVGVVIASLISIPIVWFGVRRWKDRQGVVRI